MSLVERITLKGIYRSIKEWFTTTKFETIPSIYREGATGGVVNTDFVRGPSVTSYSPLRCWTLYPEEIVTTTYCIATSAHRGYDYVVFGDVSESDAVDYDIHWEPVSYSLKIEKEKKERIPEQLELFED